MVAQVSNTTMQALRGVVAAARSAPLYSLISGVPTCLRCHRQSTDARHDQAVCEFAAMEAAIARLDAADQDQGDRSP